MTQFALVDEIPSTLENGMINFEKMLIADKIVSELQKFQRTPYKLIPVPYFPSFWDNAVVMDEDELWRVSREILMKSRQKKSKTKS